MKIEDTYSLECYPVNFLHQKLIDILSPCITNRKSNGMVNHNRIVRKGIVSSEAKSPNIEMLCPIQLVKQAINGDRLCVRELIKRLTPTIQVSTAQTLSYFSCPIEGTHTHAEVSDYCQEIFMHLFENKCKVLKSWDPDKGMALTSFVSLITKRKVISSLRKHKKTNFLDDKIINEKLNNLETPNEQQRFSNRNLLLHLIKEIKNTISEQGYEIFILLFLYDQSIDEISANTGLSKNSIYVWKNRIRKQAKNIADNWHIEYESSIQAKPETKLREGY